MNEPRYLYIECKCRSFEHLLRFYHDTSGDWDDLGVSVQMSHYLPWWRRLWVAAKYVMGLDTRCHYEDVLLEPEDRKRVAEFMAQ